MKIVYVCREYPPSYRAGGIATYIQVVAKTLVKKGHEVHVFCANDNTNIETIQTEDGVVVHRLSNGDFWIKNVEKGACPLLKFRFVYRFWSYRRKLLHRIGELDDVDIIEVPEYGAEGLCLLKQNVIPVVVRLHTPVLLNHKDFTKVKLSLTNFYKYFFYWKELQIVKDANYITSCSTPLKKWFEKYVKPMVNIEVIYNPINIDITDTSFAEKDNGGGIKTIFYAGTLCDWKGVGDLYEACNLLAEEGKWNFTLVMAGKIGEFAIDLANKASGKEWFNLIGKQDRKTLYDWYKKATVICFPSWWENMPMVCLEAMSLGACVIGSNRGGMSEIITDGEDGYLLDPCSPEIWKAKIEEVFLMDEKEKEDIGKRARSKIAKKFATDIVCWQMESYYNNVIADYKLNRNSKR